MNSPHLIVHNPFGNYSKGALITDPAEVQRVLSGDNRAHVHRIVPVSASQVAETKLPENQG